MNPLLLTLALLSMHGDPEQPRCVDAEGVVEGQTIRFRLSKLPFRDRAGHALWLRPAAASSLLELVEKANRSGFEIDLNSAYRTTEQQLYLWHKKPGIAGHPMRGGERTHQTGFAVDISGTERNYTWSDIQGWERLHKRKMQLKHCRKEKWGYSCPTMLYWWLVRSAPRFGFKNNVPGERWHWTYLGPNFSSFCSEPHAMKNRKRPYPLPH